MKFNRRALELAALLAVSLPLLLAKVNYYYVMIIASVLIAVFERFRKDDLKELGITRKKILSSINAQMPFTIAGIAGIAVYALFNGYTLQNQGIGYFAYWLVSIPLQEFLFRGYLQSLFRKSLSTINNVALVSVIFSLTHYFAATPHFFLLMVSTLFAGFAWGYYYEKERNLIGPMVSHLILGTIVFLVLPAKII